MADNAIDFDRYIPFGLTAIANKVARGASRVYLELFGVGINEWRILANLKVRPGISAHVICVHSGLDKAAVSRGLKHLEDTGYIIGSGGSEGRGRQMFLTPRGESLHDRIIRVALAREARLLSGFSEEERCLLRSFILRLHANVEDTNAADYRNELPEQNADLG